MNGFELIKHLFFVEKSKKSGKLSRAAGSSGSSLADAEETSRAPSTNAGPSTSRISVSYSEIKVFN